MMRNPLPSSSKIPASREEILRFLDLIRDRTGLFSGRNGRHNLAQVLSDAAANSGCETLDAYYHMLSQAGTDSGVWDLLISAVTVGETYFFRNADHFNALRHHILPALVEDRKKVRRLRIWSAGCSTGEEPYSLAILLRQIMPENHGWNISILATDINKKALEKARRGLYSEWSFRQTEPVMKARFFSRNGTHFKIRPDIQEMVTFSYLNLVTDLYPSLPTNTVAMDLIVCRNVAIYLDRSTMKEMAEKYYRCLVPGGWLIVGAPETDADLFSRFEVQEIRGAFVYRRPPWIAARTTGAGKEDWMVKGKGVTPLESPPLIPSGSPHVPVREPHLPKQADGAVPAMAQQEDPVRVSMKIWEDKQKTPGSVGDCEEMARVHANAGRFEQARRYALEATARDPLNTGARYTLALMHQESAQWEAAIREFKMILYLDPCFILTHFSLANLYLHLGRTNDAARHRTRAIRLAAKMPSHQEIPGSEGLTPARLLTMMK